jgi:hypothetical protein
MKAKWKAAVRLCKEIKRDRIYGSYTAAVTGIKDIDGWRILVGSSHPNNRWLDVYNSAGHYMAHVSCNPIDLCKAMRRQSAEPAIN